jgi:hypothetical protein
VRLRRAGLSLRSPRRLRWSRRCCAALF